MNCRFLQPESSLPLGRKRLIATLAFTILVFSVYANTFDASWHFDDVINITENPQVHMTAVEWPHIKKSFFQANGKLFRPVANLTFALNYYAGGLNVWGYHLVNTLVHLFSALFLFFFIHHTLHLPLLRERYGPYAFSISFLATAFWALNPVQTQAVTYIVQRMASMAALFSIMALYFYLRARTAVGPRMPLFLLSGLSFLLALGCKENTALLPLSILFYDVILVQGKSPWEWARENRGLCLGLVFLFALVLVGYLLVVEKGRLTAFLSGFDKRHYGPLERVLTQPRVLLFYLGLLFYPDPGNLCVNHDFVVSRGLLSPPLTLLAILIVLAAVSACLFLARRAPLLSFCVLFYLLNHAVEASFLPIEMVFEHRNYLPSMLLFLPVAAGVNHLVFRSSLNGTTRALIGAATLLVLVAQGHATFMRNFTWKTEESLWVDCIDKYPNLWRPYVNLGKYYADTGRSRKAIRLFRESLGKRTANDKQANFFYKTYYNLGVESFRIGEKDKALFYYHKALKIYDGDARLLNNVGALYFVQGDRDKAEGFFRRALRQKPRYRPALTNLAGLLLERGEAAEARKLLQRALERNPRNRGTLLRMSLAHRLLGQHGKALLFARKALGSGRPRLQDHLFLARTYAAAGQAKRARRVLARALRCASPEGVRRFAERLANPLPPRVLFPRRDEALKLLSEACLVHGKGFLEAARCAEKKGASP